MQMPDPPGGDGMCYHSGSSWEDRGKLPDTAALKYRQNQAVAAVVVPRQHWPRCEGTTKPVDRWAGRL